MGNTWEAGVCYARCINAPAWGTYGGTARLLLTAFRRDGFAQRPLEQEFFLVRIHFLH
jgi:hypothetical protein